MLSCKEREQMTHEICERACLCPSEFQLMTSEMDSYAT